MTSSGNFLVRIFERVSFQERINFTRHLSVIINAGLPLLTGLQIIRKQTSSRVLGRIIEQLITDVNNGKFLADGLERYRHVFGDLYVSIVRIGETSGTLASNLSYLWDHMRKSSALKSKVRSALIYPVILLVMTILITGFLTFYVFPKMLTAFTSLNVHLPWPTRVLIATLGFLRKFWWLLSGLFIAGAIVFRLLLLTRTVRYLFNRSLIALPVVGRLITDVNIAYLSQLLAVMLKSGSKIVESLTVVSRATGNIVYQRALTEAAEEVRRGRTLSSFLATRRRLFPPLVAAMAAVGETTGNLEQNLFYLSEYYTEEVDEALRNATSLLEPAIILAMGLVVGFVALAVITPVYSLTQGFH